jgi:hypothetical protein
MRLFTPTILFLVTALSAQAQTFVKNTTLIPGGAGNGSTTENLDFADVDGDGDLDAIFADGGDGGNDRNRIWINQGGLQGGTLGRLVDETNVRFPAGADTSRDVDFADIDLDGDPDIYVSNTASVANQGGRWLVNLGGAQGQTAGFFADETSTRWVNVGVNDGVTTFSSIGAPFAITTGLFTGSFIDWSCDAVLGDLDGDGDPDLVHTSYGPIFLGNVPVRVFLNDGAGHFEEHNPSGVQLPGISILNGDPGLWAEGVHQHGTQNTTGGECDIADTPLGVELGDLDGDFDIDILNGARNEVPRIFQNRASESGGALVPFRDETHARFSQLAVAGGNYEQELGDLDADGDLDIYGINWAGIAVWDGELRNDGSGHFSSITTVAGSGNTNNEAEWFDYDGDGDLDVYVAAFSGQDQLYANGGAPAYGLNDVTASELPPLLFIALGADSADVDGDGDYDVLVAMDNFIANVFLENVGNVPDTTAPRIPNVEHVAARTGATTAAVVRAHVYDNSSWDIAQYDDVQLAYKLNDGSPSFASMTYSGGQVFRGEIPAALYGTVEYRVEATDEHGNLGVSTIQGFSSAPASYCTAGLSASGCTAALSALGAPSASAATGFVVNAANVEGSRDGLFFFGTSGRIAQPWGNGSSFKCVASPTSRGGLLAAVGTTGACDGAFAQDINARWTQKPAQNPGAGAEVQVQLWYRDPQNTSNKPTSFSDALEFLVGP